MPDNSFIHRKNKLEENKDKKGKHFENTTSGQNFCHHLQRNNSTSNRLS